MCGIAGLLRRDGSAVGPGSVEPMMDRLAHRGPDDAGLHLDGPVGLGFRRLSIIDLVSGHQPLCNETGDVWVTLNGEIYNHPALRADLEAAGHRFATTSDTEVIVHLYEEHGLEFPRFLTGMFAIALWDAARQRLVLVRDRVGIKPLYVRITDDLVAYGSEIGALLQAPGDAPALDPIGVDRFLSYFYVPGRRSLLDGVEKLAPGSMLVVEGGAVERRRYWRLAVGRDTRELTLERAVDELDELLDEVVRDHLLADVPLGFLVSGGLDSSVVLAIAARHLERRPQTFTVGFDAPGHVDERPGARQVAEVFGADHHEITVRPEEFWGFLPTYVRHMEEPVCEAPAIALARVAALAAETVKVVLSGEGGDEAFAGYDSYRHQVRLARVDRLVGPLGRIVGPRAADVARSRPRGQRLAPYLDGLGRPLGERYLSRTSNPYRWFPRHRVELYTPQLASATCAQEVVAPVIEALAPVAGLPALQQMLQVDTETWLPDDLLVKADKMTMLHSLELRVPLLDHRVLEWAARLEPHLKLDADASKVVLRTLAARILPAEVVERRKAGFPVPYERWLRTTLRDHVDELLLGPGSRISSLLRPSGISTLLEDDRAGERLGKEVFSLVVLELWLREFTDEAQVSSGLVPPH